MLPKKGRKLPLWEGALAGHQAYAELVAELLRKEHGDSHRAVKQLMRQTEASERSVKHWLAAEHGPDSVFLLRLMATSPVIRAFVLGVMERHVPGRQSAQPGRSEYLAIMPGDHLGAVEQGPQGRNDRINDPHRDPINDPITGLLNQRQRWFLDRVAGGARCTAVDIIKHWRVSPKTAQRDIAGLRSAGLLQFFGARRNGRYKAT